MPAHVDLQLDGSRVKLKDSSTTSDRQAPGPAPNPEPVMVTYRFDAIPHALRAAIPRTYDDTLFEAGAGEEKAPAAGQPRPDQDPVPAEPGGSGEAPPRNPERIEALLEQGQKVTVIGVGPNPERKGTCIVAGVTAEDRAGAAKPVAVRIDHETALFGPTGAPLRPASAAELAEGGVIIVEGRQSKRGVIRAKRIVVLT